MAALLLLSQAEAADAARAEAHGCMGPTSELLDPQELSPEDLQQLGLVLKFEVAATVGQVRVHRPLLGQTCKTSKQSCLLNSSCQPKACGIMLPLQ